MCFVLLPACAILHYCSVLRAVAVAVRRRGRALFANPRSGFRSTRLTANLQEKLRERNGEDTHPNPPVGRFHPLCGRNFLESSQGSSSRLAIPALWCLSSSVLGNTHSCQKNKREICPTKRGGGDGQQASLAHRAIVQRPDQKPETRGVRCFATLIHALSCQHLCSAPTGLISPPSFAAAQSDPQPLPPPPQSQPRPAP